jgi:hypothetical protein
VTVVEWGEGLVEDLAPGHLEITISMPPAEVGPGAAGEPVASETRDENRAVRLTGTGDRWLAPAESASLALLSSSEAL